MRKVACNEGLAPSEKEDICCPSEDGEYDDEQGDIGNWAKYWLNNGNGAERFGERRLVRHGTERNKEKSGGQKENDGRHYDLGGEKPVVRKEPHQTDEHQGRRLNPSQGP